MNKIPSRNHRRVNMVEEIEFMNRICNKYNLSRKEFIDLRKSAEMDRQNTLLADNGDIIDQHIFHTLEAIIKNFA